MGLVVAEGQAVGVALRTLFAVLIAALVACAGSSGRSPSSPSPSDPSPAFVAEIALTVADLDGSIRLFRDALGAQVVNGEEASGPDVDGLFGVSGARVRIRRLRVGEERLTLMQFLTPAGTPALCATSSLGRRAFIVRDPDGHAVRVVGE